MKIKLYKHDLPDGLDLGPVVAIDSETLGLNPHRDRLCLAQLSSGDGTAHVRPVTVAQISEGQALIDEGLQANETVVVDGQYRLTEGSSVHVLHGRAAKEADLQSAVEKEIP